MIRVRVRFLKKNRQGKKRVLTAFVQEYKYEDGNEILRLDNVYQGQSHFATTLTFDRHAGGNGTWLDYHHPHDDGPCTIAIIGGTKI